MRIPVPSRKFCGFIFLCASIEVMFHVLTSMREHNPSMLSSMFGRALTDEELELAVRADEARVLAGLGDRGQPVDLTGEANRLSEQSIRESGLNLYLSDRMPYYRRIRDVRHPLCSVQQYPSVLPSVSVVIPFHDEYYSVLLRTVCGVLRTSCHLNITAGHRESNCTYSYLKEIILVDDCSSRPELGRKLDYYVRTRLPSGLIRIIRLTKCKGPAVARLEGARAASGEVLLFLDAHCEGAPDWLRPLLLRVKEQSTAVVVPVIHNIGLKYFEYKLFQRYEFPVGGFSFDGHFQWVSLSAHERRRRGSDIAPTRTATIVGGIFAINRDYFWEVGGYDELMSGWGGENLEMSFRVWMCGGSLEVMPCSCVGHLERNYRPYHVGGDSLGINTARMAEVWMDDYKELFYLHRPEMKNHAGIGDVSGRKALRRRLQCRPFQWYLSRLTPEMVVPVRDTIAFGRFRVSGCAGSPPLCLQDVPRLSAAATLPLRPCLAAILSEQYFLLTLEGALMKNEVVCVQVVKRSFSAKESTSVDPSALIVVLAVCADADPNQTWNLTRSGHLIHAGTGLCLGARGAGGAGGAGGGPAGLRACGGAAAGEGAGAGGGPTWDVDYSVHKEYGPPDAQRDAALKRIKDSRQFYMFLRNEEYDPPGVGTVRRGATVY